MPTFREQKILTRALFLNRHGFVAECYPAGIVRFYECMYPGEGPLAGYRRAGLSFLESGFFAVALEAFEEGLSWARRQPIGCPGDVVAAMEEDLARARAALARRGNGTTTEP
jgi:hypothetical protein